MEVEEEHSYLAGFFAVSNCQNWLTSQALRDKAATAPAEEVSPEEIVAAAKRGGARIVTSTYNEPLITSEWAVAVFRVAKPAGLLCSYVSNGNGTEEVLEYIRPYVSLYKVDLKGFRDRPYRELGGTLERVLWTIRTLHEKGFWVEVVTLVVPGFNDSDEELRDIARFLASVSPDIPWHVTAFHPDYKMTDRDGTPVGTLVRAAEIGVAAGLRYVYAGNLPGRVEAFEHTYCPGCRAAVIRRRGYTILEYRLAPGGRCASCGTAVAGRWMTPGPDVRAARRSGRHHGASSGRCRDRRACGREGCAPGARRTDWLSAWRRGACAPAARRGRPDRRGRGRRAGAGRRDRVRVGPPRRPGEQRRHRNAGAGGPDERGRVRGDHAGELLRRGPRRPRRPSAHAAPARRAHRQRGLRAREAGEPLPRRLRRLQVRPGRLLRGAPHGAA
jgi:pyruvate formate lyase activating enzyme